MPDPEMDTAVAALGAAHRHTEAIDQAALDTPDLVRWLRAIGGAVTRFRELTGEIEYELAHRLAKDERLVVDGMVVERTKKGGSWKKWDNDAVRSRVMAASIADPDTGEMRDGPEVADVMGKLYPLGGSGLRLTAARELIPGWETGDFAERSDGTVGVKITEASGEAGR